MRQPWIYNPFVDSTFIIGVPFFVVAFTLIFSATFRLADSMTVVSWAILVMGVDVSHVYSTLYRTYLDPETREQHRFFLFLLPFAVLIACMTLYAMGALVFWRVMAYVAVFHFVRQQYGFMRVYARHEDQGILEKRIDTLAIYTAAFYPIIDWHLAGQKNFNWFMKGDFVYFPNGGFRNVLFAAYLVVIAAYCVKEIRLVWKSATFNLPRNGILAGTFLSWYVGIVHFNSDLAFTAINVISHGIPYMALVWIYGRKKYSSSSLFRPRYVALFIASLLIFAYIEEGLWNTWVWHDKEHRAFFGLFHAYAGELSVDSPWLKIIVPLLSVPQITHYIIDGFIWKMRRDAFGWRDVTLARRNN